MTADFALAVDYFLIRQYRAQLGHQFTGTSATYARRTESGSVAAIRRDRLGLVRLRIEPGIVNLEENPLRPFVIARIGRVHFPLPVVGETDPFQL